MPTTTVRVTERTHNTLRDLACQMEIPMQEVLARAVEAYRRQQFFAAADAAYARLQADPKAWAEELEERRLWDNTLMDGLKDDPYPLEGDA